MKNTSQCVSEDRSPPLEVALPLPSHSGSVLPIGVVAARKVVTKVLRGRFRVIASGYPFGTLAGRSQRRSEAAVRARAKGAVLNPSAPRLKAALLPPSDSEVLAKQVASCWRAPRLRALCFNDA